MQQLQPIQPQPLEPQADQQQLQQLINLGFTNIAAPIPQRVIAKIGGSEKTGKTHLTLTAPEPIIFISIDIGTEGVVEKFQNSGRQVYVYDLKVERGMSPADYNTTWTKVDQIIDTALKVGKGTIVFDTWTEMYELARLKHFAGRMDKVMPQEYPVVYADLRDKIRRIYDSRYMSAMLLTKMTPDFNTKQLEEKGFRDTDFLVQANFTTSRVDVQDPATGAHHPSFRVAVRDCRQNPMLNGMVFQNDSAKNGDQFNMEQIIWLIHNWSPNGVV